MKVLITDYEQGDTDLERALFTIAGVEMAAAQCRSAQAVIAAGVDADAFIAANAPIDARVMNALPRLHMISTFGVGVDHIDVDTAKKKGIWVCNVPDASVNEVATHALAMSLGLIRHLWLYDRAISNGHWHYAEMGQLRRPSNSTLGVIGLGRIGRHFVELASPIFSRIIAHDPYLDEDAWPKRVQSVRLEEVFSQSDILSLHAPLTEETRHIVDAAMLDRMKQGGYLVNTARGGLVDTDALIAALDRGHLAGAALDVLPEEPPSPDHPVRHHPRIITSPHAAFYSVAAEEDLRRKSVMNVLSWLTEGRPRNVVVEGR